MIIFFYYAAIMFLFTTYLIRSHNKKAQVIVDHKFKPF